LTAFFSSTNRADAHQFDSITVQSRNDHIFINHHTTVIMGLAERQA